MPYAELHCHSNFSFLDGASHPEELATEAARLGLEALALTDHDGFYGIVRFAEAARAVGMPTVFGTEITLTPGPRPRPAGDARPRKRPRTQVATGQVPDATPPIPHGDHLLLLADGPDGYARLARTLSLGHLAGEKRAPQFTLGDVAAQHGRRRVGADRLPQGRSSPPRSSSDGPAAAGRELQRLIEAFGRDRVLVELWDHGDPLDSARNDALAELAARHARRHRRHDATPTTPRRPSAAWPPRSPRCGPAAASPSSTRGCRRRPAPTCARGPSSERRFARYPGVVELAAEVGRAAAFDLTLVAPSLPPFPCPDGS